MVSSAFFDEKNATLMCIKDSFWKQILPTSYFWKIVYLDITVTFIPRLYILTNICNMLGPEEQSEI